MQKRGIKAVAFVVGVCFFAACGHSESGKRSSGALVGGMLGAGGEEHEFWAEWTPREPVQPEIAGGRFEAHLFEAWRVEERPWRGQVWDGAFLMLGASAGGVEEAEERGVQSAMMRLSANIEEAQLEVSFFTANDGGAEGLVWRLVEPGGAGVWIEAEREVGSGTAPDRWTLRVEPAFEEAKGRTVWWEREEGEWVVGQVEGAGGLEAEAVQSIAEEQAAVLLEVLEESLWESVTMQRFVEPPFAFRPAVEAGPLAPGWPAALEQVVEPRGLEDFVRDTVFWPRDGGDILAGNPIYLPRKAAGGLVFGDWLGN